MQTEQSAVNERQQTIRRERRVQPADERCLAACRCRSSSRQVVKPSSSPARPPEDCGGPGGFADLKELLARPPSPEREEMRAWAGEEYDPAHRSEERRVGKECRFRWA